MIRATLFRWLFSRGFQMAASPKWWKASCRNRIGLLSGSSFLKETEKPTNYPRDSDQDKGLQVPATRVSSQMRTPFSRLIFPSVAVFMSEPDNPPSLLGPLAKSETSLKNTRDLLRTIGIWSKLSAQIIRPFCALPINKISDTHP